MTSWKDKFPKKDRYYEEATGILYNANSLDILKEIPDNSIDTVITDPPYGLSDHSEKLIRETLSKWLAGEEDYVPKVRGFMGNFWDAFVPPPILWKEVYRVMKPGATALVFAGTRTQDLMTISLRLAGFEVKDTLMWIFSQGFPKGIDISKQIDRKLGFQRNKIPIDKGASTPYLSNRGNYRPWMDDEDHMVDDNVPISPEAKLWNGYKSALKPAYEPIILCVKLNEGSYAQNALKWGVAGLNIDSARIPIDIEVDKSQLRTMNRSKKTKENGWGMNKKKSDKPEVVSVKGRFPSNVIFECTCKHVEIEPTEVKPPEEVKGGIWKKSEGKPCGNTYKGGAVKHTDPNCPCYMLDKQSGLLKSGYMSPEKHKRNKTKGVYQSPHGIYGKFNNYELLETYGDKGGASRFFYCAKASKKERGEGTQHPTIKPLKLLEYLVKLTSMPGKDQIYLDPFVGSGSLAMVCKKLNKNWIAIEISKEYSEIAKNRIKAVETQLNLWE